MSCPASAIMGDGIRLGWVLLVLASAGCGSGGPSYYEKEKAIHDSSIDFLKERGAKFTQKRYPEGTAWLVDMQGMTVGDEVLAQLKRVGYITELTLSKSSITDEQLAASNNPAVGGFLLKLDLSRTAVT